MHCQPCSCQIILLRSKAMCSRDIIRIMFAVWCTLVSYLSYNISFSFINCSLFGISFCFISNLEKDINVCTYTSMLECCLSESIPATICELSSISQLPLIELYINRWILNTIVVGFLFGVNTCLSYLELYAFLINNVNQVKLL